MKEPGRSEGASSVQLRRGLLRNMLLLTLLTASIVGTVLLAGANRAVGDLSETAIEQAMDRTESELTVFFGTMEVHLGILRAARAGGVLVGV